MNSGRIREDGRVELECKRDETCEMALFGGVYAASSPINSVAKATGRACGDTSPRLRI
jgi:hypothetical protein